MFHHASLICENTPKQTQTKHLCIKHNYVYQAEKLHVLLKPRGFLANCENTSATFLSLTQIIISSFVFTGIETRNTLKYPQRSGSPALQEPHAAD